MKYRVKYREHRKWELMAGFVRSTDALVYAKDLSARWPLVKVALFENGKIHKMYTFVAGKRFI